VLDEVMSDAADVQARETPAPAGPDDQSVGSVVDGAGEQAVGRIGVEQDRRAMHSVQRVGGPFIQCLAFRAVLAGVEVR
jgi:hypothetical protein